MKPARVGLMASCTTVTALALGGLLAPASAAESLTVCATGCDYTTIQDAVDAATDGDVITVQGPLTVSGRTTIDKAVTVTGAPDATVTQTTTAITFLITGDGATLSNLDITSETAVAAEFVQIGADGVTLAGDTIHGPEQAGEMGGWVTNRGFVTQPGITDLEVTGNTIYSLRSGAYLNPNSSGTIEDNTIYDTKGDFLIDNADFAFTGNQPGDLAERSEWSFVVFPGTDPARYTDLAALSSANHDMSAWDQRTGEKVVRPLTADDCKKAGWRSFTGPAFPNQGQCVQFVNTGKVGRDNAAVPSTAASGRTGQDTPGAPSVGASGKAGQGAAHASPNVASGRFRAE